MNKNKEVMVRICVLLGICSLALGVSKMLYSKSDFNEDKLINVKKVEFANIIPIFTLIGYDAFMQLVSDNKLRVAEEEEFKRLKLLTVKLKSTTMIIKKPIVNKPIKYNPYDLNVISNLTTEKLHKLLEDTTMKGLENAFIQAEREYGVNALFLVGLVANESGWNTSNRATNGSNNLTGHAVYVSASRGSTFDSKADCIYSTARLIKDDYLNKKGQHYNGESIWDINKKYSETKRWAKDINSIVNGLINKNNKK
jgi:beta-N-acetylglucosaminidase